jgi:hypothetical protein
VNAVIVGVDPGPTTGIAALYTARFQPARIVQCDARTAPLILAGLMHQWAPETARIVLAIEKFVVRQRAGRSSSAGAGQVTRDLVGELTAMAGQFGAVLVRRAAAEVKPWALDERLAAAELLAPTKGMPHARDAARHTLFAAVRDCGMPDPLSAKARTR